MRIERLKEILDLHKEHLEELVDDNFGTIRQLAYDQMYEDIGENGKSNIPDLLETHLSGILGFMKGRKERALKFQGEIVDFIEDDFSECFTEEERTWLIREITKFDEARQVRPGLEGILNAVRDFQD